LKDLIEALDLASEGHGFQMDDGGSLKIISGKFLSPKHAIALEIEWHLEPRNGKLQEVHKGEKYRVRVHWGIYF